MDQASVFPGDRFRHIRVLGAYKTFRSVPRCDLCHLETGLSVLRAVIQSRQDMGMNVEK